MSTLTCDIVTPETKLYSHDCYMVVVPGIEGTMGFLEDHAPLVSTLKDGVVRVLSDADNVSHRYAMQGGYVEVSGKKVIVLADRAIAVEDIDQDLAKQKLADAEAKLEGDTEDEATKVMLQEDLAWYRLLQDVPNLAE